MAEKQTVKAVPTNIITGFLGVGKTTAIRHLLAHKPANERWAVLVNEFGEVGIDGALFDNADSGKQGIFVKEVPGGCMCCTSGITMQVALNLLLAKAKPDRLLIEPTGLGHPKEVLSTLGSEHYRDVIEQLATITLVDARKIRDPRYTGHDTFNEQLEIANVIVANKADCSSAADFERLSEYLTSNFDHHPDNIHQVSHGELKPSWLGAPIKSKSVQRNAHSDVSPSELDLAPAPELPDSGYLTKTNQGSGFVSQGWIFDATFTFDAAALYNLFVETEAERIKGVFICEDGIWGFNKADDVVTQTPIDEALDSRIEIIISKQSETPTILEDGRLEAALKRCL